MSNSHKDNVTDIGQAPKKKAPPSKPPQSPMINLPPMTKWLVFAMIAVFFVQEVGMTSLGKARFFSTFGFIPTNFSEFNPTLWLSLVSPVTYMFIHASFMHLIMNGFVLLAFGAGLEKAYGGKTVLILFFVSGLVAIGVHFLFGIYSPNVVMGASGATSGLFAAGIIMLKNMNTGIGAGPYGIYPLIVLFVAITIVFGLTGSPDGNPVAWIAHLGGFAAGLGLMKLWKKW